MDGVLFVEGRQEIRTRIQLLQQTTVACGVSQVPSLTDPVHSVPKAVDGVSFYRIVRDPDVETLISSASQAPHGFLPGSESDFGSGRHGTAHESILLALNRENPATADFHPQGVPLNPRSRQESLTSIR